MWSPFLAVSIWVVIYIRFRFRIIFLGVLYYFGDLKGDPNLENYPDKVWGFTGVCGFRVYGAFVGFYLQLRGWWRAC